MYFLESILAETQIRSQTCWKFHINSYTIAPFLFTFTSFSAKLVVNEIFSLTVAGDSRNNNEK